MSEAFDNRSTELIQLMMKYQRRIFAYIHTLVPSRSDAEDILQETSLTICEKFKDFEIGTNFYSWACQIAYWKVKAARKKYATAKVVFNQEVMDVIAQTRGHMEEELDHRHHGHRQATARHQFCGLGPTRDNAGCAGGIGAKDGRQRETPAESERLTW